MNDLPRVMVGGPVRDRQWSAPLWLGGLLGLDYPRERLTLAVLANDCADGTARVCGWWAAQAREEGWRVARVAHTRQGCTVDNNHRQRPRDYRAFARARDAWVAMRDDEEWLLQVDSDVQVPGDLLRRLLAIAVDAGTPMLAAGLDNSLGAPSFASNVMRRHPEFGRLMHPESVPDDRSPGALPCDLTGACVLLHRSLFDAGHRYADGLRDAVDTEDQAFCRSLLAAGVQPHYAPSVRATHWMKAPEDLRYLRERDWYRRLALFCADELEVLDAAQA